MRATRPQQKQEIAEGLLKFWGVWSQKMKIWREGGKKRRQKSGIILRLLWKPRRNLKVLGDRVPSGYGGLKEAFQWSVRARSRSSENQIYYMVGQVTSFAYLFLIGWAGHVTWYWNWKWLFGRAKFWTTRANEVREKFVYLPDFLGEHLWAFQAGIKDVPINIFFGILQKSVYWELFTCCPTGDKELTMWHYRS